MANQRRRGGAALAVLASAALLVGVAGPVAASDAVFDLPAGLACPGFDLRVAIDVVGPQNYHEFTDANDNVVWALSAGRGNDLTFTNLNSGATLSLEATGSVNRTVFNRDGSQTVTVTGMTVLIMFPTDVPAGPSTTLYVGRVMYSVDSLGTFTILGTAGTRTDICAALSD
jgi:hypothetical protein